MNYCLSCLCSEACLEASSLSSSTILGNSSEEWRSSLIVELLVAFLLGIASEEGVATLKILLMGELSIDVRAAIPSWVDSCPNISENESLFCFGLLGLRVKDALLT